MSYSIVLLPPFLQTTTGKIEQPKNITLADIPGETSGPKVEAITYPTSWPLKYTGQQLKDAAVGIITTLTLANGNYIVLEKTSRSHDNYFDYSVRWYYENGVQFASQSTSYTITNLDAIELAFGFRTDTNVLIVFRYNNYYRVVRYYEVTPQASGTTVEQYLQNAIPPEYTWKCWPQLSGNAGTFLMDLSMIAEEIIGDGSTPFESFDGSDFDLVPQSELYALVQNLLNAQETTIAYCGDNYLTATRRTTLVNDVTTVYVTLKFYFRSDVLIYTSPEFIVYSSDNAISRDYLAIIYDTTEQVAATNIIQYWTQTGKYGINEYTLPSDVQMRALYIWLQDNGEYREHISPYDTGTTDNGGDPGTPTPQDHITDSPIPTLGGLDLGVVTLYLPTAEQMQSIAAFLWSDNVLDNFKKYFNNFADNLLSLYVLPFTPSGLNTKTFKVGNMTSEITDVAFCTTRYIDRDMGTFNLEKLWDSYLDFSPYTRVELYLPYLGLHSLDTDELMCPARMDGTLQRGLGSVLSLTYRLDLLTGVIVAKVKVNGEIRYQFEGKVGLTIPLTGQTYAQMAQAIVQAGAGLATTIASGGLTAPLTAAAAVTGTVNASKPNVERIGNISGDASMLATNVPYLIVTRPNKPLLDEQEIYTGFPSYKSGTLGSFSGFTQVIEAHVEGISCTEEERTLILKWLKEGVII